MQSRIILNEALARMDSRRGPTLTVHPEFLTAEEQLCALKLQDKSTIKKFSPKKVFGEQPRTAPVANLTWSRLVRRRQRKMNQYPSVKKYITKSPCTFGVVGHHEGSEVDVLERMHKKRPGPASYSVKKLPSKGGKFNLSRAKSDLEWKIHYASQTPGPADFDPKPLTSSGGKFSTACPKSDVEWLIYHAARKPGVGEYNLSESFKRMTGPGPCTRLSAIERGLQKQSNFKPARLPRTVKGKDLVVTEKEHLRRSRVKPMARGVQKKSPQKITRAVKKLKDVNLTKSRSASSELMFVQKLDSRGRVRVGAVAVPRF